MKLGYRPNFAAQALASGRGRTIGVVVASESLFGAPSMLHGVEQAIRAAGYFVSIAGLEAADRSSAEEAVDRLLAQQCAGIILIMPDLLPRKLLKLPEGFPAVALGGGIETGIPLAAADQVEGASIATRFLLSLGHRTVWHVAGDERWFDGRARVVGWRKALEDAGAEVPPVLAGDWSPPSGYEAGLRLAEAPGVTAVFAANDEMALGLLRAFHTRGIRVPEDVSVVGFDDLPEASYFQPPLTTIRHDLDEVARRGFALLQEQVEQGTAGAEAVIVTPSLVVRESTAPRHGPS